MGGGDIMVTFMNSVAKARENPAYINDARKASIILLTEWASFAVFTVLGGPIVDCIWDAVADACGCGYRGEGKLQMMKQERRWPRANRKTLPKQRHKRTLF